MPIEKGLPAIYIHLQLKKLWFGLRSCSRCKASVKTFSSYSRDVWLPRDASEWQSAGWQLLRWFHCHILLWPWVQPSWLHLQDLQWGWRVERFWGVMHTRYRWSLQGQEHARYRSLNNQRRKWESFGEIKELDTERTVHHRMFCQALSSLCHAILMVD